MPEGREVVLKEVVRPSVHIKHISVGRHRFRAKPRAHAFVERRGWSLDERRDDVTFGVGPELQLARLETLPQNILVPHDQNPRSWSRYRNGAFPDDHLSPYSQKHD